jgi:ADP-ribose pyrophosphatase
MAVTFPFSKFGWEQLKDKKLFETPIFSLHELELSAEEVTVQHPFYILNAPDWVNTIALTPEREIILVEQYRAGIAEPTLEIPGGMVDQHEQPIESAKRELREETGFISSEWELIGKTSSNPAILNNYTHLYVAKNCTFDGRQELDGAEDIAVHTLPLSQFLELIQNGVVHHAIVLAAVARFLLSETSIPDDLSKSG